MHDDTWDELIDKMTDKLPGMVNEFLQQFQASGFYGQSAVSDQDLRDTAPVSYTHLTLPTNREV